MTSALKILLLLFCFALTGLSSVHTRAAMDAVTEIEMENFLYEYPTLEKLSRLYWALGRLDSDNIAHLDHFMMLNECDIYNDYFNHEFEWRKIRESAKTFVETNKKNFPLRFQFMQPLRLGEYNIKDKEFEVFDDYKIKSTRRFEVRASDARRKVCGPSFVEIDGYPRGLILELSRPFELESFPLEPAAANKYISEKLTAFKRLSASKQNKKNVFQTRDAYLVMKVKIFATHEVHSVRTKVGGKLLAQVLGVLEGVEIYSDKDRQNLLYIRDFRKKRKKSALELQYIAEYQDELAARKAKEEAEAAANGEASDAPGEDDQPAADAPPPAATVKEDTL